MSKIVDINPDIVEELRIQGIEKEAGLRCLLSIYFGVEKESYPSDTTVETMSKIEGSGIIKREYKSDRVILKWAIPLFSQEKDESFAWISEYMDAFSKINPTRRGTKSAVLKRMKKFFTANPEVRLDDVKAATNAYIKTVNDPQYLKFSHKFIYEGRGLSEVSMLEQWVEITKGSTNGDGRNSKMRS